MNQTELIGESIQNKINDKLFERYQYQITDSCTSVILEQGGDPEVKSTIMHMVPDDVIYDTIYSVVRDEVIPKQDCIAIITEYGIAKTVNAYLEITSDISREAPTEQNLAKIALNESFGFDLEEVVNLLVETIESDTWFKDAVQEAKENCTRPWWR